MSLLRRLNEKIHASSFLCSFAIQSSIIDQKFRNHQNFCAHVKMYLTLKRAIKFADIDLLRHALRKIIVIFQTKMIETSNYAQTLLRVLHLIDSSIVTKKFQNVILINSLINLQRSVNTNFEVDKLVKLLNLHLKTFRRDRSVFFKHSDKLLEN